VLSPTVARRLIHLGAGDGRAAERVERARQRITSSVLANTRWPWPSAADAPTRRSPPDLHMSVASTGHVSRLLDKLAAANRVQAALIVLATATPRGVLHLPAGVASLVWMALLTALMVHEKTQPSGRQAVPVTGVALLATESVVLLPSAYANGGL
jgi:Predicted metal-binding integral membrane protein (DUF2182)